MESCHFNGDNYETTFHLGIYLNQDIIGVSSFFKKTHPNIPAGLQYQLRGMAILESFQGEGMGHKILSYGENILKEKKVKFIWCHAREIASNFYLKNGYQIIGQPFHIESIGIHNVMYKDL